MHQTDMGGHRMGSSDETAREFWRGVLVAGGVTTVPRWTLDPRAGVAEHDAPVPEDLRVAVAGLAAELAVPERSVLLAAHAVVLSALSGEEEVTTRYVPAAGAPPLPCPLTAGLPSWRSLVLSAARAESGLLAHAGFPVEDLRRQLDLSGPVSDAVFDAGGGADGLPGDAVLAVTVPRPDVLRVRYRTDAVDGDYAARLAGYHLAALRAATAGPDADPRRGSLVPPEEVRFQVEGLAGPRRELPDRRVHELIEQQAAAHPDAVAAVLGQERLTYAELNARANRLARALLARGLGPEDVVAVVTERNLDWLAAVLAVFKAGGAYLPIEPHFPAGRIATTLRRAACRLVLSETGSTTTLDEALGRLPGTERLLVDEAAAEGHPDGDLGIPVGPDRLAYLYFTSGSTGEPKGAMCEHAGMLNHLVAKISDLGIGEGTVVAQTAPQCFDISLWQLLSALLVGGRTLIVPQDVILDVPRFVDTVTEGRVGVAQLVPSYLEAVVTHLEQEPRELPHLRYVSATGEALKKELVQRWFAVRPDVALVNAYGLTETSDDTNHEVMRRPPDGDRVPLGRPIANVRVYVVDEQLRPVPLGAPGLIAFAGICVGRGYVNDPERTRQAYLTDPFHPGDRLYLGGDHGRWLPGGTLDFLGRKDNQVKISGFRIEIGEIENTLLRVPGVRDGAVVVAQGADQSKRLVAFYAAERPIEADVLRAGLGASLPAYMVPGSFHWQAALPLTANSKIDRKALTASAEDLATVEVAVDAPRTATERRLAAAWATVLGISEELIGRQDHFFERGGTSLSAVKLAIALDRAVSLKDVVRLPVLADLADLVDTRSGTAGLRPAAAPPAPRSATPPAVPTVLNGRTPE
jgi:amino acid adenylation domain-containing protein